MTWGAVWKVEPREDPEVPGYRNYVMKRYRAGIANVNGQNAEAPVEEWLTSPLWAKPITADDPAFESRRVPLIFCLSPSFCLSAPDTQVQASACVCCRRMRDESGCITRVRRMRTADRVESSRGQMARAAEHAEPDGSHVSLGFLGPYNAVIRGHRVEFGSRTHQVHKGD